MKTLTAALILEKNKLASTVPWITLLAITLDDASVLRLAVYPEDVTFAGNVYAKWPCVIDSIAERAGGNIGTLQVAVANVDRTISAYLETQDLLGNAVTVRTVHASHLSSASDCIDNYYRINRITVTQDVATFELGHEDLLRNQIPGQRYLRGRCRFVYKDAHCGYPSDEFGLTTKQVLKDVSTTSGAEKLNGWYVANSSECDTLDIAVTSEGYLTEKNKTGAVKEWWDSKRETAYAYKIVTGDFDVETLLVNTSAWTADGLWALFLAQSNTTAANWVAISWTHDTGGTPTRVTALSSVSSTTTENDATETWYRYARIVREGTTVTWYVKAAAADDWTTLHSETRSDMGSQVRVGFTVCPRDAGAAVTTVQWDYLRVNAGGLPSCDYTLDAANGCRAHQNTLHFGGFPSIPSGRLYGI